MSYWTPSIAPTDFAAAQADIAALQVAAIQNAAAAATAEALGLGSNTPLPLAVATTNFGTYDAVLDEWTVPPGGRIVRLLHSAPSIPANVQFDFTDQLDVGPNKGAIAFQVRRKGFTVAAFGAFDLVPSGTGILDFDSTGAGQGTRRTGQLNLSGSIVPANFPTLLEFRFISGQAGTGNALLHGVKVVYG